MTEPLTARGRVVEKATILTFEGWLAYNPDDPEGSSHLMLDIGSTRLPRPPAFQNHRVERVRIEVPL